MVPLLPHPAGVPTRANVDPVCRIHALVLPHTGPETWGSPLTSAILSFLVCAVEAVTAPLRGVRDISGQLCSVIPGTQSASVKGSLLSLSRRQRNTRGAKKGQADEETGWEWRGKAQSTGVLRPCFLWLLPSRVVPTPPAHRTGSFLVKKS